MPCRYGMVSAHRLRVELVEADIEIGFALVDMAQVEWSRGELPASSRILLDAEEAFEDAGQKLKRFCPPQSAPFLPLIGELRRAIDLARARLSG